MTNGGLWFDGADLHMDSGLSRSRGKRGTVTDDDAIRPWLTGACLLIGRPLWEALGGFTDDYFLYWEDVDLSHRAARLGARLVVSPEATAVHDEGGTHGRAKNDRAKSPTYYRYNIRNRLVYAAIHLDAADARRWRRRSVSAAYAVLLQGGRRQFLRPVAPVRAATQGTLEGLAAMRRIRRAQAPDRLRARHPVIRLYRDLRTAHLERGTVQTPSTFLYSRERYDFDHALARGLDVIRAGTLRAAIVVLRSGPEVLEVNEPLVRTGQVRTLLCIAAGRVAARRAGHRMLVVTYAIENLNPFVDPIESRIPFKPRLLDVAHRFLGRRVAASCDRIVYGTHSAEELYRQMLGRWLRGADALLVPALPTPCGCATGSPPDTGAESHLLFLGAFEDRKGVRELLAAWPLVLDACPRARLRLIGKGPLEDEVRAFAKGRPEVEVSVDPPRAEVHAALRAARCLVLLSSRRPRWREQVGLPIVEALAHGCTVVTTGETGLAEWLSTHGHTVVTAASDAAEVAAAIVGGLDPARSSPADRAAALPAVDGRIAADDWLLRPVPRNSDVDMDNALMTSNTAGAAIR